MAVAKAVSDSAQINERAKPYVTLRSNAEVTGEFTDRKSRFIAQLIHVESEEESAAFIAQIRSRHYDARHNVPAQILSNGFEKASDDGEPSRTAGMPVLDVLRGANLKDVCCVVTRYFGGTLLGPGGLVRAYSAATAQALENAQAQGQLVTMTSVVPVEACVPYNMYERALNLANREGAHVFSSDFAAEVTLNLVFKAGEQEGFISALTELMSGKDVCTVGPATFSEF